MGEGSDDPFTGIAYQRSCISVFTLQFTAAAVLQLLSSNGDNFIVEGHYKMRNCIKGWWG